VLGAGLPKREAAANTNLSSFIKSDIWGIIGLRSVIWTRVATWPLTGPVNLARISPKPLQRVPISLLPGDYVRNRVTVGE